jgi:hypothetical protein
MSLPALARYWKAAIAALAPVFLVIQAAVTDDTMTTQEWVAIAAATGVAIGVLAKGNAPAPPRPPPPAADERRLD